MFERRKRRRISQAPPFPLVHLYVRLQLCPHLVQFWALCLSICICVSASSFFSEPLCQWREAEEWSVRLWCRWPLPRLSTAHEAGQLRRPPEPKSCDNPVWRWKFDEISVHLMCNHYPHLDLLERTSGRCIAHVADRKCLGLERDQRWGGRKDNGRFILSNH